jgi:uracil-DNA glycosylase
VLLINSILTVSEGLPLSHQGIGWESFVGQVLSKLSDQKSFIVFVLWGQSAQKFKRFIDADKHKVIAGVHPSPLSAHRGFFGSKPFSTINQALLVKGLDPINW